MFDWCIRRLQYEIDYSLLEYLAYCTLLFVVFMFQPISVLLAKTFVMVFSFDIGPALR